MTNPKLPRFMWLSNAPWAKTGYGNQTALFLPEFQRLGYDPAVTAFWGLNGAVLHWNNVRVYPKGFHNYGQDIVAANTLHWETNVMFSLMDAWVCNPAMYPPSVYWIPWFPVDHDPLPPPVRDKVSKAFRRIVFTKFAQRVCREAGLDSYYVPHGVNTEIFHPLPDRKEARKFLGWKEDKFVIAMVAANKGAPSRKAFPQILQAIKKFSEGKEDVGLYLHTRKNEAGEESGVNLPELVSYLGITPLVGYADQYQTMLGFDDQYMNAVYNAADVHLLVSMGEGFGIPIVEAQAAGCPVIVGDWTSMGELCFSGWKVPKSQMDPYWTPLGSYQFLPRVEGIWEAMEKAFKMRGNADYRKRARKGALAYSHTKIADKYWAPVLRDIFEHTESLEHLKNADLVEEEK